MYVRTHKHARTQQTMSRNKSPASAFAHACSTIFPVRISNAHSPLRLCRECTGPTTLTTQRRPQRQRRHRVAFVVESSRIIATSWAFRTRTHDCFTYYICVSMRTTLGTRHNISMSIFIRSCALHTGSPRIAANRHAQNSRADLSCCWSSLCSGAVIQAVFGVTWFPREPQSQSQNRNPTSSLAVRQTRDTIKPTSRMHRAVCSRMHNCTRTAAICIIMDYRTISVPGRLQFGDEFHIREYGKVSDCWEKIANPRGLTRITYVIGMES